MMGLDVLVRILADALADYPVSDTLQGMFVTAGCIVLIDPAVPYVGFGTDQSYHFFTPTMPRRHP